MTTKIVNFLLTSVLEGVTVFNKHKQKIEKQAIQTLTEEQTQDQFKLIFRPNSYCKWELRLIIETTMSFNSLKYEI